MSKNSSHIELGQMESKWQKRWQANKIFEPDLTGAKNPFYNLMMFPYPSAEGLHVGNMYAFTGSDIYGRYMRMSGKEVFEPIGLDGFGIHSENYALKVGKHPMDLSKITEKNFYRQLTLIGNSFSWSSKVETYISDYYKWTQWIFIKLFKSGLAYRGESKVNWCPECKTVLADEQVVSKTNKHVCERCETEVMKKELTQWFFRITAYAQRLLGSIDDIDWSESVKIAQKNWIGKSKGALIKFKINIGQRKEIEIFTTRPDTIYGATYLVLAPEHPLVTEIINRSNGLLKKEILKYVEKSLGKSEAERTEEGINKTKSGVKTNFHAINPLNKNKIPIFIADYVLASYGTGAVMGVPAHDQRDWVFSKKYHLDIVQVISGGDISRKSFTGVGRLVNSEQFNGLESSEGIEKITKYLSRKNLGKVKYMWHLRDWIISRQRYWGPPIPMIYCKSCAGEGKSWFTSTEGSRSKLLYKDDDLKWASGWYPEKDEKLPVELPYIKNFKPTGSGIAPLASSSKFIKAYCPECHKQAKRETDVSDTFFDSAWYYLNYPAVSAKVSNKPWDEKLTKKWLPVDMYIGGAEHAVLHLLYSRFLAKAFYDLGLIDFEEPFRNFRAHGLLIKDGAKMSKSKGNIVNPDDYVEKYGADTLRSYLMFCGRFKQGGDFRDSGIEGMSRFLKRVEKLIVNSVDTSLKSADLSSGDLYVMNKTIMRVSDDIQSLDYNTAISAIMEWMNHLETRKQVSVDEASKLLAILAPFAPFITEELWERLGNKFSIHTSSWPQFDPELAKSQTIVLVVQVNGKVRDKISTVPGITEAEAKKLAAESVKVTKHLPKKIKDTIYVQDKIINIVG